MQIDKNLILELVGHPIETDFVVCALLRKPELRDPDLFKDVLFEDIVFLRRKVKCYIMHQSSEFIDARENLLDILDKLIIERIERNGTLYGGKQ